MRKSKVIITALLITPALCCQAGTYREKYAAVLHHYQTSGEDNLKYEAAQYLIDHMDGHMSPEGIGIDKYVLAIRNFKPKTDIGKLSKAWGECHTDATTQLAPDSSVVSCDYLIANIDDAFTSWSQSPWQEDVSFSLFCEHILPYRVSSEHLSDGWRAQLREAYHGLLNGVTDVKKAFAIIRNEVLNRVSNSNSFTPHNLDVLSYEHIRRANCDQRCILLASVLRAFAIPAAVDFVPHWADYSTMGHTWVSLVLGDGATYTVYEDEMEPKQYNCIDASAFLKDNSILNSIECPLFVKTEKKVAKIYRAGYSFERKDVSQQYGLDGKLTFNCQGKDSVYLCTFLTGKDWMPIAQSSVHGGQVVFEHLGKGVVYLPVTIMGGKRTPLSVPILVDEKGQAHSFREATADTCTIVVGRKYPLCTYMPSQWTKLIGGVFEGADNADFNNPDTLAVINSMPCGPTIIDIKPSRRYRYIRFKSPDTDIALLSELAFLTQDNQPVDGTYIYEQIDSNRISLLFDQDIETRIKAYKPGYWIGMDLGEYHTQVVDRISFTPVSDGNEIQKGHLYELYGFDTRWKLLGRNLAMQNGPLIFRHIPRGMILLLKDKTKGREERIFDYRDGKQIWY